MLRLMGALWLRSAHSFLELRTILGTARLSINSCQESEWIDELNMHILQTKDSITQLCRSDSRVTLPSCHILNLPLRNHIVVSQPKAGVNLSRALRASGCVHAYMSATEARVLSILEGYVLRGTVIRLDIIMRW